MKELIEKYTSQINKLMQEKEEMVKTITNTSEQLAAMGRELSSKSATI
jgi:hypothetical protein